MPEMYNDDCLIVLRELASNSIDSGVMDPPYDLTSGGSGGFMGKKWDATGIAFRKETWKEVLRVLKPGAFLLSFGGSRTYHRMTCAIEDAGFEIRDCCVWIHGQGFPKSLSISKAIDKELGAEREVVGSKLGLPGCSLAPDKGRTTYSPDGRSSIVECDITAPATDEAKQWDGFGTALKPAVEFIVAVIALSAEVRRMADRPKQNQVSDMVTQIRKDKGLFIMIAVAHLASSKHSLTIRRQTSVIRLRTDVS